MMTGFNRQLVGRVLGVSFLVGSMAFVVSLTSCTQGAASSEPLTEPTSQTSNSTKAAVGNSTKSMNSANAANANSNSNATNGKHRHTGNSANVNGNHIANASGHHHHGKMQQEKCTSMKDGKKAGMGGKMSSCSSEAGMQHMGHVTLAQLKTGDKIGDCTNVSRFHEHIFSGKCLTIKDAAKKAGVVAVVELVKETIKGEEVTKDDHLSYVRVSWPQDRLTDAFIKQITSLQMMYKGKVWLYSAEDASRPAAWFTAHLVLDHSKTVAEALTFGEKMGLKENKVVKDELDQYLAKFTKMPVKTSVIKKATGSKKGNI